MTVPRTLCLRYARATHARRTMATPGNVQPPRVVLWLRRELRLHDSALFHQARMLGESACVLPAYVYDPREWASPCRLLADTPRCSPQRARFVANALSDLRTRLRRASSGLAVLEGRPEDVIPLLRPDVVFAHAEFTPEEQAAEAALAAALHATGAQLRLLPADTLFAASTLPFAQDLSDLPTSGVTFLKRVLAVTAPAPPLPNSSPLPPLGAAWSGHPALVTPLHATDVGGETAGLALLSSLLDTDDVRRYAATRNELRGGTRLSPFLALGCLSARHVAAELASYNERRPGAVDATGAAPGGLLFELGVRDFFRFSALRWGRKLFAAQGPVPREPPHAWCSDAAALQAWRMGATGVPLIDAIMRHLLRDGHISNRARQITASWAVLARGLDWRACAEHFESRLTDYDASANACNWLAVCGLSGGRENWFNITTQAGKYDPDGVYVREFLPELAGLPTQHVHAPWELNAQELAAFGVVLGETYPRAELHLLRAPPPRRAKGDPATS